MGKEHKASIDGDQWARCVQEHGWLWDAASGAEGRPPVTLILAHGAGAPMDSAFMSDMAARLAAHGVNVLRFEFPYMAQRRLDGGHVGSDFVLSRVHATYLECMQFHASVSFFFMGKLTLTMAPVGHSATHLVHIRHLL